MSKYLSGVFVTLFLRYAAWELFVTEHFRDPNQHTTIIVLSVSKFGLQVVSAPSGKGLYAMKDGNGGLTGNPVGFIRDRRGFKQTGD
jgi:hypothetical protein